MKSEGVYLDEEEFKVKSSHPFEERPVRPIDIGRTGRPLNEEKAVHALNEAIREAALLTQNPTDLSRTAKIVEKIQVAMIEAERAAFIAKSARAVKCYRIAQRISVLSRQIFHEFKCDIKKPHAA